VTDAASNEMCVQRTFHFARLADTIPAMVTDPVALAFANWVEAHKKHVEAQKRLAMAQKVARSMGMLPPQELIDEVSALGAEAERLLTIAQKAMQGGKSR
jgi:hypothetical protein